MSIIKVRKLCPEIDPVNHLLNQRNGMSQTVDLEQWWYTKHPDIFGNVHFLIVLNDYLFKWLFILLKMAVS